jgi:hypothetical protein
VSLVPFDFPADLSRFPKATQAFLTFVHDLGWQIQWGSTTHKMAIITSPPDQPRKQINVPSTNVNANRLRSWNGMVRRYTDVEVYTDAVEKAEAAAAAAAKPAPAPTPAVSAPVPDTALARALAEAKAAAADKAVEIAEPLSQVVTVDDDKATIRKYDAEGGDGVTLVSETPWMVRKDGMPGGKGRMYESHASLHRVWSDGTEDYRCRFCDYTAEAGRSVSMHAAARVGDGVHTRAPKPEFREVPKYVPTDIKQSPNTTRRLTSDLLHALDAIPDWQSMDRETLARQMAQVIHENRPDRAPAEPLTADEIISRIVLMVDRGRLAEMHQQVESMAAAMRDAASEAQMQSERAEAALAEADRLREERRALAALLSEDRAS